MTSSVLIPEAENEFTQDNEISTVREPGTLNTSRNIFYDKPKDK